METHLQKGQAQIYQRSKISKDDEMNDVTICGRICSVRLTYIEFFKKSANVRQIEGICLSCANAPYET